MDLTSIYQLYDFGQASFYSEPKFSHLKKTQKDLVSATLTLR